MRRAACVIAAWAAVLAGSCAKSAGPAAPPACCAAPGYSRAQIESVVGRPAPPESTKFNPYPSPPPNGQIYPTQHGYLTVTYASERGNATHLTLDFYEGKAPDEAFALASAYLPADAHDTGARVSGKRASIRVFQSADLATRLPASHGTIYLECIGGDPSVMCLTVEYALGTP